MLGIWDCELKLIVYKSIVYLTLKNEGKEKPMTEMNHKQNKLVRSIKCALYTNVTIIAHR